MGIRTCFVGFALMLMLPCLAPAQVRGQNQIEGKIWNPYGSLPCEACLVELQNSGLTIESVYTDSMGNFRFTHLRPGSYIIRVNIEGFQEVELRTDVGANGAVFPITILLDPTRVVRRKSEPHVVDVSTLSEKHPKKAVELFNKAAKNREKGNKTEAIAQLEEAVRIAPNFFEAHDDLGKLYRAAGRLDEAENEFLAAKSLNESNIDPLIQLSGLYIDRNQPELAVRMGEEAVRKDSRSASAFFNLGLALYRLSRLDRAEVVLKKALALAPSAGQIRLLLANVYLKNHDWENLRIQLDSYLAENPDSPERAAVEKMRAATPNP